MQIQNSSVSFGPLSGSGPQIISTTVTMAAPVIQATVVLTGFITQFSGGGDEHLGQLDIRVTIPPGSVMGTSVPVQVLFGLRDWSGNWNDPYDGQIFFTVIGE